MTRPGPKPRDPASRFWPKVDKSGDCWLWTGSLDGRGYGTFYLRAGTSPAKAHRFAYEAVVGPIPEGMSLDHRYTCLKNCVNPEHLRPVTHKQNMENRAGARAGSRSGVRGVLWEKRRNRWVARVKHDRKMYHVGEFVSLEDAEAAVIAKRNELFTHNDLDRVAT